MAGFRPATVDVWGLPFARVTLEQSIDWIGELVARGEPEYLITANLNYVMLAAQQASLRELSRGAIGVLADGMPIVWRSRIGSRIGASEALPERVAGSEMIYRIAERSARDGWRIYFLGAAPGIAQRCADALLERNPGMQIAGVESPPFRQLTAAEEAEQEERIRAARPDVLLVAFGQPKGEQWIAARYKRLGVPVSIQLGASFDFVAGAARRAPLAWQKVGMEWAYRMLSDPRRLVPRYAENAAFLAKTVVSDTYVSLFRRTSIPSEP
ncbi:WecB/TagA/CpsF family glycosyltransferase [Candidatus Laterigemmans baculatus]|uniref:WecB/TagA/CpsF family glycosyltransferase n=1 Tax=Candidatus Laterigemmans baculatus TaxID=2770505 RepID=UPI0013DAB211|nr:WecB/TagA/CpsF family glycosyltransferase [Candidatus Laterigemmans baculatus]